MRRALATVAEVVALLFLFSSSFWSGIDWDRTGAEHARRRVETLQLLLALEEYQDAYGALPQDLDALPAASDRVDGIDLTRFSYSPDSESQWLVSIPDPADESRIIVGRCPTR